MYLYHLADNEETMARDGSQAVVWQTAINPVVALELLADRRLDGRRRARPEAFPARRSSTCSSTTAPRGAWRSGTSVA